MQKRNSRPNIHRQIALIQNDLMTKLAAVEDTPKQATDSLEFLIKSEPFDSLTNLLSKAKQVTRNNKDKIQRAKLSLARQKSHKPSVTKKISQNQAFLTGIGLASQSKQNKPIETNQNDETKMLYREYYANPKADIQESIDQSLKNMIKKKDSDDLAQLRQMIKETGSNLQDCGKQLQKTRKQILSVVDKFSGIDYTLFDQISRYERAQ